MTLEVHVPAPEPGGDYATIVGAAAVPDTLKRDAVRAVLRLRAPRVDAIIATSGDGIYDRTFSGQGGASSSAGERARWCTSPDVQNESSQPTLSLSTGSRRTAGGARWYRSTASIMRCQ